jgi:ubiquitin carboxyl-terminal hydrolase 5/13
MISESVLQVIRAELCKLRVPSAHDKVYKDECVLSFDSPYSTGGLYVNLATLQGYGADYWRKDAANTNSKLYLHEVWEQTLKPKAASTAEEKSEDAAPTKLAIGTEDGFNAFESPYDTTKIDTLCVLMPDGTCTTIDLPCTDVPEFVTNVINGVIAHDGMRNKMQIDTWSADSEIKESKYSTSLIQLPSEGKKISSNPKDWKCEMSGDTENLWLNLSTGYIGGGRKNWDGSGGSGAALIHFEETGKQYPLCVKLGTITAHSADIWSYAPDEDTLVTDSKLAEHLSHWGIDIQRLEKTDTSMAELEVKLNMKYDWAKIMENGADLVPLFGPGLVGLRNIGSTCYMNSVMQCLISLPFIQARYLGLRDSILASAPTGNAVDDFAVQMSKLAHACLTSTYCAPEDTSTTIAMKEGEADADKTTLEKHIIAPRMLKQVIGKSHPEFSGGRQQDAAEYFQYFLDQMTRAERTALPRFEGMSDAKPTSSLFEFHTQNKMKCSITEQVRLTEPEPNNVLELHIPMDAAINRDVVDRYEQESKKAKLQDGTSSSTKKDAPDAPKLEIPFQACIDKYVATSSVEYANPSLGGQSVPCPTNTRFRSFPEYLAVKMNRYVVGENWVEVKIDAVVEAPEILDLTSYARDGLAVHEVPMPDSSNSNATSAGASAPEPDAAIVAQLVSMGFSENGCKRAALAVNNSDAEAAMNWVFAHMEDPDFNDPPAATMDVSPSSGPPQESIDMLQNYGFTAIQCEAALRSTDNNIERAADWLFSHTDVSSITADTVAAMVAGDASTSSASPTSDIPDFGDAGSGKYELISMISHIGNSTAHGHYVCHRRLADGRWALFNDEKVALSTKPPKAFAYMYFYKRV